MKAERWENGAVIRDCPDFMIGTSYMTSGRSVRMWEDWDPERVDGDLLAIEKMKMDTVKIYLFWNYFFPSPEKGLNPEALDRLDQFLELADRHGLRIIVDLMVGHMSGENYIAAWTEGRDLMTDPTALRGEIEYIAAITGRYRGDRRILAWDVCNEILLYRLGREGRDPRFPVLFSNSSVGVLGEPPKQSESWLWLKLLTDTARVADPTHPVYAGIGTPKGFALRDIAALCDYSACYGYDWGESYTGNSYLCGFERALTKAWDLPCLVEEFGISKSWNSEEYEEAYYRRVLYSSLLNGCIGALSWQFCDFETLMEQDPYLYFDWELRFGMVRDDRSEYRCCETMREFSSFLHSGVLDGFRLPKADLHILLCECYDEAHTFNSNGAQEERWNYYEIYRRFRDAGLRVDFIRENDDLSKAECIFVPGDGDRKYKSTTWVRLMDFIRKGGKLIKEMKGRPQGHNFNEMFGVNLQLTMRYPGRQVTFCLPDGTEREYRVTENAVMPVVTSPEGTIPARDEEGQPVMVRHALGEGLTLLLTLPFSHYASGERVNGGDDGIQFLYGMIREEMGIRARATADRPCIETGVFLNDTEKQTLLLAVNHRATERAEGRIDLGFSPDRARNLSDGAPVPVLRDEKGSYIRYDLPAGEVLKVLFE